MLSRAERACLVLADVSGYTGYLTGSELEHAQDVLADLFETVVGALRPVLRLAKLEGDAAFAYALEAKIDGSMLLDTIERCYFAFQRRLRSVRQATTCPCNACVLIPNLNEREHRRVIIEPDNVEASYDVALPAPPAVTWEYITDPQKRMQWQVGTDRVDQFAAGGRRGVGTTNHCVHGHDAVVEEILDWRPFDYFTEQSQIPHFGPMRFMWQLTPTDEGTLLQIRVEKFKNRKQRDLWPAASQQYAATMGAWFARLAEILRDDMASREPDTTPIEKHELHTHDASAPQPAPPHAR